MRLHTTLLILCLLHVATDAAPADCDPSLVKEILTTDKDFNSAKELTCKNGKLIVLNGETKQYDKLKCEAGGWTDGVVPLAPVKKANEELKFKCEPKACLKSYIQGAAANMFDYSNTNELTCKDNSEIIVDTKPYDKLKCDALQGFWYNGNVKLVPDQKANENFNIKCEKKACHDGYITGAPKADYTFASNELKCTGSKVIEVTGELPPNQHNKLTCVVADGWKDGNSKLNPEVKAKENLKIACVAKNPPPPTKCVKGLIKGVTIPTEAEYASNKLTCTDAKNEIEYEGGKLYKELRCDDDKGWIHGADVKLKDSDKEITVKCAAKACHKSLISGFDAAKMKPYDAANKLECTKSFHELEYNKAGDQNKKTSKELVCDPAAKWKSDRGTATAIAAIDVIDVTCVVKACHKDLITDGATGSKFDAKTLTCHPGVIEYNGVEHKSLKCDETLGWSGDGGTPLNPPVNADAVLTVTCKKFCEVTGAVVDKIDYTLSEDGYAVTCKNGVNEVNGLFYNDGAAAKPVKVVTCTKADGWKADNVQIGPSDTTMTKLECKKGCDKFQRPTADPNQWEDGLTPLAKKADDPISSNSGSLIFECKTKVIRKSADVNVNNAIKLNEDFVHSHLRCSIAKGYTDFSGKVLEQNPYAKVKISCVDSKCIQFGSPPTCNAVKPPGGFECIGSGAAFTTSIDPNQLSCNNELYKIYDNSANVFLDVTPNAPIICKEEDEYSWHKYDDAAQEKIANVESLVCLQKGCNACTKLATFTDRENFIEGTPDDCATVKCPNNLWMIKTEDGTAEEEYAGEVKCAYDIQSDKIMPKWVIDADSTAPKKIVEGRCFDGPLTKCAESAKLETTCKSEWPGCKQVVLDNDNPVTCPTGKMFYKHKEAKDWHIFEEGAESIKCDPAKGVWTVTPGDKELKRGDTVICADSNPITTTLAPTTTKPSPCSLCPQIEEATKEIAVADKDDETCTATGKFQTKNAGTVEGELTCAASEKVWKTTDGKEVGQVAAFKGKNEESDANMGLIIGGAVGGVVLLLVVIFIVFKLVISRRKPKEDDKDEETKRRMLEEGKKRKKKRGDNDEILDEVSVDAPSELKL